MTWPTRERKMPCTFLTSSVLTHNSYRSVTTVLAVAAAYGFFETGRGMYFILEASRERAREANSKRNE